MKISCFYCSVCSLRCDDEELFLEHVKQHHVSSSSEQVYAAPYQTDNDTETGDCSILKEGDEHVSNLSQSGV